MIKVDTLNAFEYNVNCCQGTSVFKASSDYKLLINNRYDQGLFNCLRVFIEVIDVFTSLFRNDAESSPRKLVTKHASLR